MSVWGVSAVAILDSSVNCVCVWSTKKLTMRAFCVAANCNNSQMTAGIAMHNLQWGESGLNLYNSNELTFLLRCIMHICVVSTSVSVISQTPWHTAWGLLRSWHNVLVLFQNPSWQAQTDTAVSLWVSRESISFVFGVQVGHFAATPQSDIVGIWSHDLGIMAMLSVRQKTPFSCIYNPQITVSPTSSFSASFNGNRVKNHP